MRYCFNPACTNPQNPDDANLCQNCGSKLLLHERYRTIELIGEGGFSRTFLAVDEHQLDNQLQTGNFSSSNDDADNPPSPCIIKQFLPVGTLGDSSLGVSFSSIEKANEIFNQEASRRQQLERNPHIATLLDYFEEDRRLYQVVEFVEGENLLQELKQKGTFSEVQIVELLTELLPVLDLIHQDQVIHRDINPENIQRRSNGELVLIDFGISEELAHSGLARTGTTKPRGRYVPIEQVRGGKVYPASDLYSLGVTCIQLLTGVAVDELYDPLPGSWVWREALQQAGREISENLERVLEKLLKDGINERYQSALEVMQELKSMAIAPDDPRANSILPLLTLTAHSGWVWSVAFSPDGQTLASGSNDHTIILWDVTTGAQKATLTGHSDMVLSVAFSPDGQMLASGSRDKNIMIWNVGTSHRIRTFGGWFSGHSELVNSVTFSPNSGSGTGEVPLLASGSWDNTIILWDVSTGKPLRTLKGHSGWVYAVAFSADGQTLASGSRDETIILWNVSTGQPRCTLNSHYGLVDAVSFSPDGQTLAMGALEPTIVLWNIDTQQPSLTLQGHSERVNAVAFSPDGQLLASASRDKTVILWDVKSGDRIRTFTGHCDRVLSVAFSPDGQLLASGSGDGTLKIWQVPNDE